MCSVSVVTIYELVKDNYVSNSDAHQSGEEITMYGHLATNHTAWFLY